ncbi:MAG: hypothetical protein LBQ10_12085 [Desulfovibrio sp.]|jgi:hypothetical protein|nr:hypothetical protein [Desulfovibrio sp.]
MSRPCPCFAELYGDLNCLNREEKMGMPKYAAKTDRNQDEIVRALLRCGCDVHYIRRPVDLLVGRAGKNYLLEIKVPKSKGEGGGQLTPEQAQFFGIWRGQAAIVETPDEALRAVGLASG